MQREEKQEQQSRLKPKTNTETTTTRITTLSTTTISKSMTTRTTETTINSGIDGSDRIGLETPPTNFRFFNTMPRPGQPGAPLFDDTNVTEFLRRWNIECEDVGFTKPQRCDRLPYYCTPDVKDVVELLDGYLESDWDKLQRDLKDQYWQNDTQKNTPAALNQLIRDASTLDLSIYILKYISITQALLDSNEMSIMQRCRRFLDDLFEQLRDKAFDFCAVKDWKFSTQDIDI